MSILDRFSSSRGVFRGVQGGLFLRKRPLKRTGFPLQQLENRYSESSLRDARLHRLEVQRQRISEGDCRIDRLRAAGRQQEARNYTVALAANLILNAGWSWLFFRYNKLGASAVGAVVLAASSADLTRRTAAAGQRAGVALLPYPLWCAFATVMSVHIWVLNRR